MTTRPALRLALPCLFALTLALPGAGHADDDIAAKAAVCTACHGEAGVPVDASIPVIWGQNQGYLYIELRDYKLGNRSNEFMSGVAAGLEKADMMALAEYFAGKPWTNLRQPGAPADVIRHAQTVAASAQCPQCHLSGYVGDSAVPRLAGQGVDYLRRTMLAFHTNERKNNSWMSALLSTYTESDIDALAQYLAGM